MRFCFLLLLTAFFLSGCIAEPGKITVDLKKKIKSTTGSTSVSNASVSSVKIINNQLVINGSNLSGVEEVKINGTSFGEVFTVESKTATQIIANSLRSVSFDVSKVFNLILSEANASATFQIDFALCNATLNGKGFDCSPSTILHHNDVLSYDSGTQKWKPRAINNLSYIGLLDASGSMPAAGPAGQYYIVSVGGHGFSEGDWAVSNGSTFDQINNATYVTKVFGRTGDVEPEAGDYSLDMLADVNINPTASDDGKVLKYDHGSGKWILALDNSGGGASSVTTSTILNGAVTDAKIDTVSASKITGTINSTQILDGTIVNADIAAGAAIDYSKLNIPNTSIPYAKLNIADGDIPVAKINGLPSATVVLATTITDGDTNHAPTGEAVYEALLTKLGLTGGTLTTGTINGIPTPVNPSDVVNKDYVDDQDALLLLKTGGTLSGLLSLDADLRIKGGATNYVTLKAHATTTAYDFVFPQTKGTNGYVLSTDGNGNTSWVAVTDSGVQAFAKTTLPNCNTGEVLKANGTSFSCVTDASGGGAFTGTASRAVATGTGGALEVSATTATELGYVNGVTSSIQTQLNSKEGTITAGTSAQYYRGDKTWQALNTSAVTEGSNLYYTDTRAIAAPLTGVSSSTGVITSSDTILGAFGKLINTQNDYVSKTANSTITGTLTINSIVGALTVPDPVNPNDAVNKKYVDGYGQWTKSGSDITRTSGNVGIGAASPTHSLDIQTATARINVLSTTSGNQSIAKFGNGFNTSIVGTEHTSGATVFGNTIANATIFGNLTNNPLQFTTNNLVRTTITAAGNVGINTSSPGEKLEVDGNIRLKGTGKVIFTDGTSMQDYFGWNVTLIDHAGGQAFRVLADNDTTTSPILSAKSDHKVGVNTDAPASTLSVNGGISTGTFYTTAAPSNALIVGGKVGVGSSAPSFSMHVAGTDSGNAGIDNYSASSDPYLFLRRARGSIGSPATVASGDVLSSLYFSGHDGANFITGAKLEARANGTVATNSVPTDLLFYTGSVNAGSERMRILSDGKVGIGTATPLRSLHVGGDADAIIEGSTPFMLLRSNSLPLSGVETAGLSYQSISSAADTTIWPPQASISFLPAENHTTTEKGTKIYISTTPIGSVARQQRVVIEDNGNVGIGSASSNYSAYSGTTLSVASSAVSGGNIENVTLASDGAGVIVGNSSYVVNTNTGATDKRISQIRSSTEGTTANNRGGNLAFWTKGDGAAQITEKMRIDSSGNVGVGFTTLSYKLHVNGSVAGVGAYQNVSDERFKKDISQVSSSLERLTSLEGVYYNWRQEEFPEMNFNKKREMGVIAQKVEKVFPEAVSKDSKGFRSVAYSMLIAPIIESIKEIKNWLIGHDKALEANTREIASLKSENEAMKSYLCSRDPKAPFCTQK